MRRSWLWVLLLLSLGINIGVLATVGSWRLKGRPDGRQWGPWGAPPIERLADRLRIEGEPREDFLAIQRRLFETTRAELERLEAVRSELRQELGAEVPDRARIEGLLAEIGELHVNLDRALVDTILESRRVLTVEQQERYQQVLDRLRQDSRPPWRDHRPRPRRRRGS